MRGKYSWDDESSSPSLDDLSDTPAKKIKKRPGRKPNPASPTLRKAQNRAAQRAFRERKERHLHELEETIKQLREQRNTMAAELKQAQAKMNGYRVENWYLKGVVLTLQFVCLHHQVPIPAHAPYLSEEALDDMAKVQPDGIESYVNTYTKNNADLKPTMAAHFASMAPDPKKQEEEEHTGVMSHAIQRIRRQMHDRGKVAPRLQPTLLQLAIPHDARIDLIPTPHMRDRMILFRDIMDYDRCFSLLTHGANYRGGDPTVSASWEVPDQFLDEFWFLATNYIFLGKKKHVNDFFWPDPLFNTQQNLPLDMNQFPFDPSNPILRTQEPWL
ncbi:hypothetical protein BY458DRAFT_431539 [Sporodiniella umbellata]|nr:hypothetical protein BY458DRAFT_431539 [Sporodiniella umbellata]